MKDLIGRRSKSFTGSEVAVEEVEPEVEAVDKVDVCCAMDEIIVHSRKREGVFKRVA